VIPLMIFGDAPTSGTGLGRITRDLAVRIHENLSNTFRVATFGTAGSHSSALPFAQYQMLDAERNYYIPSRFPEVWHDFGGDEPGILMTIWDASRLLWLTRPEYCPDKRVKQFLETKPFLTWGYLPIDATGPKNKLTRVLKMAIEGFDRVLAYSGWAAKIIERTTGNGYGSLPHGIDTSVFQPRSKQEARKRFPLPLKDSSLLVGIVATNQRRKDFGLGIEAVSTMTESHSDVRLWINTDRMNHEWCLEDLLADYGLLERTIATLGGLTDEQMSWYYSACDVTLGIGSGEGFGYPIAESMACGTPCIHGAYGGAEYIPNQFQVEPIAYRTEGIYGAKRPVFDPEVWAMKAKQAVTQKASLPASLDWNNLWPRWEKWFLEGVDEGLLSVHSVCQSA
jgi:glycosyltransferase involved in cell wall biosynthesis